MSDSEILQMCSVLADNRNLRVTIQEVSKGAALTATGTILGGLIGGKTGLLAGASIGGIVAMLLTDDFKSVVQIIREDLTPRQRQKLVEDIRNFLVNCVNERTVTAAIALVLGNEHLQEQVLMKMKNFFMNELQMIIC